MISTATSGSVDTKTKILNAAEKLFGMNGFDGTSLRDITAEAQVNLAAVNYHFQSKESLIDAIIERRIEPINRSRFEMLDAAGPSPSVEKIVEAFLLPLLMVEVKASAPMLGRVLSNPDQFVERVYKKHLFAGGRAILGSHRAGAARTLPAGRTLLAFAIHGGIDDPLAGSFGRNAADERTARRPRPL